MAPLPPRKASACPPSGSHTTPRGSAGHTTRAIGRESSRRSSGYMARSSASWCRARSCAFSCSRPRTSAGREACSGRWVSIPRAWNSSASPPTGAGPVISARCSWCARPPGPSSPLRDSASTPGRSTPTGNATTRCRSWLRNGSDCACCGLGSATATWCWKAGAST